jgi:hypothetical protein
LVILNLLFLLIIVTVPGLAARAAFPSLRRDESIGEAVFTMLLGSILISGWIALLLAELGAFSLATVAFGAIIISTAVLIARRRVLQWPWPPVQITAWGVAVFLLLSVAAGLFFRPNEYVLGGRDHGIYVNTGVTIARTGSILLTNPLLSGLPADQRLGLIEQRTTLPGTQIPVTWHEGVVAPGYYVYHLDSPAIQPHGFHLYPTWFAIVDAAGNVLSSLFVTSAFAWLSLLAFILVAKRTLGSGAALLGATLLTINLAQLWYARTPSAEVMVQFLFWAGAWAWVRAIQTDASIFGLLGGLAWGQIHLAKIDYVTLPLMFGIWLIWVWWSGRYRRYHTVGLVAYALLTLHALLHGLFISTSYFFNTINGFMPTVIVQRISEIAAKSATPLDLTFNLIAHNLIAILTVLIVIILIGLGMRRLKGRGAATWARLTAYRWFWLTSAVAIIALSVYSYFVGPPFGPARGMGTYVELSWYLGLLTLTLGVIGFARRLGQSDGAQGLLLWSLFGLSIVYLAGGSFTYPDHFWAMRRFVPVLVPGLTLLAADAVVSLLPRRWSEWRQALIPLALIGGMLLAAWEATSPFIDFTENRGVYDRLNGMAHAFESDDILLFDRDASGAQVGTPLQMIFGKQVGFVDANASDVSMWPSILKRWQAEGRSVYYLSSVPNPIELPGYGREYQRTAVIARPGVEQSVAFRPTRVGEAADAFDIYKIVPQPATSDRTVTLDVGTEGAQLATTGAYFNPPVPGLSTAEWTTGQAKFSYQMTHHPRQILLRLGNIPSAAHVADVEVLANGVPLGHLSVAPERMDVYTLPFPEDMPALNGTLAIELRLKPWNPRALGLSADARDLGVLVDWIKIVTTKP